MVYEIKLSNIGKSRRKVWNILSEISVRYRPKYWLFCPKFNSPKLMVINVVWKGGVYTLHINPCWIYVKRKIFKTFKDHHGTTKIETESTYTQIFVRGKNSVRSCYRKRFCQKILQTGQDIFCRPRISCISCLQLLSPTPPKKMMTIVTCWGEKLNLWLFISIEFLFISNFDIYRGITAQFRKNFVCYWRLSLL